MSKWERDVLHPKWMYWTRIIEYLGFDPFSDPSLGVTQSNERSFVAFLASDAPEAIGKSIWRWRMEMKKTRAQLAAELGVTPKTILNWETGRKMPSRKLSAKIRLLTPIHGK